MIGSTRAFVHALGSIKAKAESDKGQALQRVHDGDTIKVYPDGCVPIRCLGIDTPEVTFENMDRGGFPKIDFVPVQYLPLFEMTGWKVERLAPPRRAP